MSDEVFLNCPYNRSHRIVSFRMPGHLIKCRKNYSGPPLETCSYNAVHLVPLGTMAQHLESCQDYHRSNAGVYAEMGARLRSSRH